MRLLAPLVLTAVLTAGCSEAQQAVSAATDCTALASDIASAGLSGTPTPAEAEQALQRLDDRVQDLGDTQVRDAATVLRDRLRDLQDAASTADPAGIREAVAAARDAARSTAEACGLPADRFLG